MINTDHAPKQEDLAEIESMLAAVFGDADCIPLGGVSLQHQAAVRELVQSDQFYFWLKDFQSQEVIRNYTLNGVVSGHLSMEDAEALISCASCPARREHISAAMLVEGLRGAAKVAAKARKLNSPSASGSLAELPIH